MTLPPRFYSLQLQLYRGQELPGVEVGVVPINGDLTAVTVGHHLHAGLQEVGGRQLEGLPPPHQHGQSDQVFTFAVPQGLVGVSTGHHSQTGLHLLGQLERPVVMNE